MMTIMNKVLAKGFLFSWLFICLCMTFLGLALPVAPVSDFEIHWRQALDFSLYIKGGALIFPYRMLHALGADASMTALISNLLAWCGFSFGVRPSDCRFESRVLTGLRVVFIIFYFCFGMWWVWESGTLEVMLIHLGVFVPAARLFYDFMPSHTDWRYWALVVAGGAALSMRMQSVLVFLVGSTFVCLWLFCRDRSLLNLSFLKRHRLFVFILISSCFAILLEVGLRQVSQEEESIRVQSRMVLYSGLLHEQALLRCGAWSSLAAKEAKSEVGKPLWGVVWAHLQEKSPKTVLKTVLCKYRRFFRFHDNNVNLWTLTGARRDQNLDMEPFSKDKLKQFDTVVNSILSWFFRIFFVAMLVYAFRLGMTHPFTALYWGINLGFLVVFGVFELNPRYIIVTVGYLMLMFGYLLKTKPIFEHA
ncbi:MAG: hypothetical protein QGI45_17115 [Myxococcota bacterium]|jgi:hypothetical protein|nr:hypothetical protein [Myxococcota bacterium]